MTARVGGRFGQHGDGKFTRDFVGDSGLHGMAPFERLALALERKSGHTSPAHDGEGHALLWRSKAITKPLSRRFLSQSLAKFLCCSWSWVW